MNTISIIGLGRVAINQCHTKESLKASSIAFCSKEVSLLLSTACYLIRDPFQSVKKSGVLILPNKDVIDLYSGGALDNINEIILASLAIDSLMYQPCDFALA